MTYSLVARDPATGQLGVAVLEALVAGDPGAATRQLGCVDAAGTTAAFTGSACVTAAGDIAGDQVSVQGNMLQSDAVWQGMLTAYEAAEGDLAHRLLAALYAAEAAGGDIRGRQSAAIFVVAPEPAELELSTLVDCRVDDHVDPVPELLGINQEAAFWQSVLLARLGREGQAAELLSSVLDVRPELAEFLRRLAPDAFPDDAKGTLQRLLGDRATSTTDLHQL